MSSSLIRCLLAVYALSESFEVVASKDVAHLLGVKRPTIHRSLEILQRKGLIQKAPYGDIHLTDDGMRMAQTLERQRDDIAVLFARRFGLASEEGTAAAFALMSCLSRKPCRLQQATLTVRHSTKTRPFERSGRVFC